MEKNKHGSHISSTLLNLTFYENQCSSSLFDRLMKVMRICIYWGFFLILFITLHLYYLLLPQCRCITILYYWILFFFSPFFFQSASGQWFWKQSTELVCFQSLSAEHFGPSFALCRGYSWNFVPRFTYGESLLEWRLSRKYAEVFAPLQISCVFSHLVHVLDHQTDVCIKDNLCEQF